MAARLGNVLYWTACGIAALLLLMAAATAIMGSGADIEFFIAFEVAAAAGVWLLGRAIRYVLEKPDG